MSSQAPTKYFRLFQKKCSKHLWSSTTPGLYNAPRMKVIGCVEKKERNENSDECNFHSHQRMRSGFDPDFFVLSKRLFGIYCLFTLRWNSTIWNATKIFSLKNADLVPSKWESHVFLKKYFETCDWIHDIVFVMKTSGWRSFDSEDMFLAVFNFLSHKRKRNISKAKWVKCCFSEVKSTTFWSREN